MKYTTVRPFARAALARQPLVWATPCVLLRGLHATIKTVDRSFLWP